MIGVRLRTFPFVLQPPFSLQECGAADTLMRPRRSCSPFWGWKYACTKGRRESTGHEDRRLGMPSKLGAGMQVAQDRARPGPVHCECRGFACTDRACKHIVVPDTRSAPCPAAREGPEKAQAPQGDHRDARRLVIPLHVEELQGGIREAQPVPLRVGVHMSGQQVQQKLYARRRVQAQDVHGQAHRSGPR